MLVKMLNQAQYELIHYPYRKFGYYLGRPFKMLFGRDNDPNDRMAYANSVLAKSMLDYYKANVNTEESKEIMDIVKRYYGRWAMGGHKLYSIMDAYAGMALMDLHQITGNDKYKADVDTIYKFVLSQDTDDYGSFICETNRVNKYIYAEMIGAVCPFLTRYGEVYNDIGAINLSVLQITNFLQYGMDEKTLIPYHGYDSSNNMKMGIIGWGQAVGKLLIGLSGTLAHMPKEHPGYEDIRQYYRRIVDKVESYQAEGGLYHWMLNAKEGPADTAATAMILSSISEALEAKILIGVHKSRMLRGVEALKACIQEDGSLPGGSAEAKGFNNYPILFDSYPWALGPAISLFTNVEKEEK